MVKLPKFLKMILMPIMSRLTPTCEVVTQKISESLEHPLPFSERVRIRLHLLVCEFCARYEKQLLAIHRALETNADLLNAMDADIKLSAEAKRKIKQKLKEHRSSR